MSNLQRRDSGALPRESGRSSASLTRRRQKGNDNGDLGTLRGDSALLNTTADQVLISKMAATDKSI